MSKQSPGKLFRQALNAEKPLQIAGTINAYCAVLAKRAGFKAIYLSGAGVANASHAWPDLGITTLNDVLSDAKRMTSACDLPLLVDVDTAWGSAFNIARCVREMINANVAAIHIEDQVAAKRCGHRPKKSLVSCQEMLDRLKAAVDARTENDFIIMARTDSLASEGLEQAIERSQRYIEAGADMIFAEAVTELSQYQKFKQALNVPILANITEFGKTPMFTCEQLATADVDMALYPLSAFRAMSAAALNTYQTIRKEGSQESLLDSMQTREELYQVLDYYAYEKQLDKLFADDKD